MLLRHNGIEVDDSESGEDTGSYSSDDDINCIETCPFEIDDLRVISLGKVVTDSEHFHDAQDIWPEGYTTERKFTSATDPGLESCYKMEVLRDPDSKFRPLFRVTMDNGEEIYFGGQGAEVLHEKDPEEEEGDAALLLQLKQAFYLLSFVLFLDKP